MRKTRQLALGWIDLILQNRSFGSLPSPAVAL